MTPEFLLQCMPFAGTRAALFSEPLTNAMAEFQINTPKRQASFLAQVAHESGSLKYVRELADGSAYDVGELAKRLGNTPEDDGDGEFYKGHGLLELTGKDNYIACGVALGIDCGNHPELLEEPINASRSAAWFWRRAGLNELADGDKFGTVTRIINGGYNGLDDRIIHYLRIRKVLGL